MTIHNELGQMPELLRAYVVSAGLKENEEGVARLGETLTPVMDIWSRPEWALLRGETPWAARTFVAAGGAGNNAGAAICNPANSGIVIVVEAAVANAGAAAQQLSINLYTDAAVLAVLGTNFAASTRDRRRQSFAQTICRSGTPAGVLAGGTSLEVRTHAASEQVQLISLPVMLYANMALAVFNNTANAALDASWRGYERKCVLNEARGG